MWSEILKAVEPYVANALIAIITALVPLVVAWIRARTQRLVVEQAATEVEAMGHRGDIDGPAKKDMAVALASERLGPLTRPSDDRMGELVEEVLPEARASARPPPDA